MSGDDLPDSAEELRRYNAGLDAQLRELMDQVPPERLGEGAPEGWTLAENLAHIAEFPAYFARQLREWLTDERVVIGRVAEYDADRNDAVVRAPERSLAELRGQAEESFAAMSAALEGLRDEHLDAPTHNVKYGTEPLRAFLGRYMVGHKAAHVEQLRETLRAVTNSSA